VARQPLDAPEDLPKETPGQVTFGQLEHEVPRMPDEASAGLEQPLLARAATTLTSVCASTGFAT
jgi:hypothetical protein